MIEKEMPAGTKFYIIFMKSVDTVTVLGPYDNSRKRGRAAFSLYSDRDDEDRILLLDVSPDGVPLVGTLAEIPQEDVP